MEYAYKPQGGKNQYSPELLWFFEFGLCLPCARLAANEQPATHVRCRERQVEVTQRLGDVAS